MNQKQFIQKAKLTKHIYEECPAYVNAETITVYCSKYPNNNSSKRAWK